MNTIKTFLPATQSGCGRFWRRLGAWGVFVIAAMDSAFFGLPSMRWWPGYVYKQPSKFFLYVVLAASGSAVGSIVLYLIGYTGGEVSTQEAIVRRAFQQNPRIVREA